MRVRVLLLALGLQCAPAAVPRAQLVVHVDTDAPVPSAAVEAEDPLRPSPLFDRLRVDLLGPSDSAPCATCTNDFAVDRASFSAGRVSFGVVEGAAGPGYRAHVRLYASWLQDGAEPASSITIERWVALPSVVPDTVTEVSVFLAVDDVGMAADPAAPTVPLPGSGGPSRVGTWAGAHRAKCAATRSDGSVCVPGGAFWLGSVDGTFVEGHDPSWHRLVTLSPYWLDAHEMTAGELRDAGGSATPWTGQASGAVAEDWCTGSAAPGPRDALPANCVTQGAARLVCYARKGDLPTVAQFAYAATRLGTKRYSWGDDIPSCKDSIWSRGGFGYYASILNRSCLATTNALGAQGGPEAPGKASRDHVDLFGLSLTDLNGNVSEWSRDAYALETDACVAAPILAEPTCDGATATVVGGGWLSDASGLRGDHRVVSSTKSAADVNVGFRCAYPDR